MKWICADCGYIDPAGGQGQSCPSCGGELRGYDEEEHDQ